MVLFFSLLWGFSFALLRILEVINEWLKHVHDKCLSLEVNYCILVRWCKPDCLKVILSLEKFFHFLCQGWLNWYKRLLLVSCKYMISSYSYWSSCMVCETEWFSLWLFGRYCEMLIPAVGNARGAHFGRSLIWELRFSVWAADLTDWMRLRL